MPSFSSFLQVAGREYEITYFDFSFQQQVDHLGRPASKVQGGIYNIEINPPGSEDNTLYEWMANPTKRYTGQVLIKDMNSGMNLKVVRFVAAYCVDMTECFDGTTSTAPLKLLIRISPEKVILDGIKHDNVWPNPTDGDGVMVEKRVISREYKREITAPVVPIKSLPVSAKPVICGDVASATKGKTKKDRYAARMAVIKAAREKPALSDVTDQFELNNKAIERAKLADDIYLWDKDKLWAKDPEKYKNAINKLTDKMHPPEGWKVSKEDPFFKDPVSGFSYAVYESEFEDPSVPVLVFRGTDNDDEMIKDWKTNKEQAQGRETTQYTKSMQTAKKLFVKYKGKLEIAGHSKGGGQAAAAGTISGAKSYTFNTAGLHANTVGQYGSQLADAQKKGADGKPIVDAFNFPYDFLNYEQDSAASKAADGSESKTAKWVRNNFLQDGVVPTAAGVRHILPAQDISGNPIKDPDSSSGRLEYHGMPYLIDSMEKQKRDDLKLMAAALGCS